MRSSSTSIADRGFTLVELMIVTTLLVGLVGILSTTMISSNQAQVFSDRLRRVNQITQAELGGLRNELLESVRLMTNDVEGTLYRDRLDLSGLPASIGTRHLPTVDPTGGFEQESATATKTGNSLLFARHDWSTDFRCTSGTAYRIDVFRIHHYYLVSSGRGPRAGANGGLDLCEFVSEPLANGHQIDLIADPADRTEVLLHLVQGTPDLNGTSHDPVDVVWRRRDGLDELGTLRQIAPGTGVLSDTPLGSRASPWTILADPARSVPGMFGPRHISVATNHARPALGVGRFGVIDAASGGFPHGFEIQVVGPSYGRRVLLHLSLVTNNNAGTQAHSDMTTELYLRDF